MGHQRFHPQLRLTAALLALCVTPIYAATSIDEARTAGLKWLVQNQKGDGSFSGLQGLDTQSTAAGVEAMLAGGLARSPQSGRALAWLANAPGGSLDSRAWQTMALAGAGRDATVIAANIRDERNTAVARAGGVFTGNTALWGPFPGYASSLTDTALGYGALRSAGVSYTGDTLDLTITILCNTLPAQLTTAPWSGSWPYALPQNGQPGHALNGSLGATALTLFELKKQRQAGRFLSGSACSKASPSAIDTAMGNAKTWLVAQANGDGGLAERNPQSGALETSSPVTTALAIRALALFAAEGDASATTALASARNWLVTQQNVDGSWRSDPFVTARVLAAFPAASGAQLADADNDGLPDVVEQKLGSPIALADAQDSLATHANAQVGVTATSFSVAGTLGQAFSYSLSADSGTAPFIYARTGGALPPGLALAANGLITGIPSSAGSYAFDYEITDASAAKTLVIGRIDIAQVMGNSDGDGPIPVWALIALGGALLTTIRRKAA